MRVVVTIQLEPLELSFQNDTLTARVYTYADQLLAAPDTLTLSVSDPMGATVIYTLAQLTTLSPGAYELAIALPILGVWRIRAFATFAALSDSATVTRDVVAQPGAAPPPSPGLTLTSLLTEPPALQAGNVPVFDGSVWRPGAVGGGGGGGGAPIASASVSGTVKTNTTVADPIVYLRSETDTLLGAKASVAQLNAHEADTTSVHGIVDTTALVVTTDARLSDARTPLAHTHDALAITSGTIDFARLPIAASGAATASTVVQATDSRLSDARTPLAHAHDASAITSGIVVFDRLPVAVSGAATANTVVQATDSRLSDARAPLAHSHDGAAITTGTVAFARLPVAASGAATTNTVVQATDARLSDARTPLAHAHDGSAITTGTIAFDRLPVAVSGSATANTVVQAIDSRLSDARTPTAHSHSIADTTGLQAALDAKAPASHTTQIASASTLGHVRVGSGLAIDGSGVLSASGGGGSAPVASASVSGTVKTNTTVADPVVYLKSEVDSGFAASAHSHAIGDVTGLQAALDAKLSTAYTLIPVLTTGTGALTFTNLSASRLELFGSNRNRLLIDATLYTQIRFLLQCNVAGTSTSILELERSATVTGTYTLISGTTLNIGATGFKDTGWVSIGATGEQFIRVVTQGGDGAADPQVGSIYIALRRV